MTDSDTTAKAEKEVKRWRAREAACSALHPVLEREDYNRMSAGELVDTVIDAFERSMSEPLPEGWRKYVNAG